MIKLKVKDKSNLSEILMFNEMIVKPWTVLAGSNGVGKSSLTSQFRNYLTEGKWDLELKTDKKLNIYYYSNSYNNHRHTKAMNSAEIRMEGRDVVNIWNCNHLSEGQSTVYSFLCYEDFLKYQAKKGFKDDIAYLFVMDELDSGLSADNAKFLIEKLQKFKNQFKEKDILMMISANSFEFVRSVPEVLDMYTGKYRDDLKDYDSYINFLCKNRKKLLKKRENNMFKIYEVLPY